MVALLASGAVIRGLSLMAAMPRPEEVWAEAEKAKTRTRNAAQTSGLFMTSPRQISCIICLVDEPDIGFSAWPTCSRALPRNAQNSGAFQRAPELEWPRY